MADVEDEDMGYLDLLAALGLGDIALHVGVFQESGQDNVDKAAWNEFGTADGRVPERSFLRSTVDRYEQKYAGLIEFGTEFVVLGQASWDTVFGQIGIVARNDVRATIIDMTPRNAPSTIARKGRDEPLVDSGDMAASITYKIVT
jgi:hypothetical protein